MPACHTYKALESLHCFRLVAAESAVACIGSGAISFGFAVFARLKEAQASCLEIALAKRCTPLLLKLNAHMHPTCAKLLQSRLDQSLAPVGDPDGVLSCTNAT